ncbi:MAG: septum formation initiator family protein [Ignavibacteria bacterium]|jgi:cell division protein FtsB
MKNKKTLTKKIFLYGYFAIILLGIVFLIFNENGVIKFVSLKYDIEKLDEEINNAEVSLHKLSSEIDSLKNSEIKIEQVAREKYLMKRESEKGFKVEEQN